MGQAARTTVPRRPSRLVHRRPSGPTEPNDNRPNRRDEHPLPEKMQECPRQRPPGRIAENSQLPHYFRPMSGVRNCVVAGLRPDKKTAIFSLFPALYRGIAAVNGKKRRRPRWASAAGRMWLPPSRMLGESGRCGGRRGIGCLDPPYTNCADAGVGRGLRAGTRGRVSADATDARASRPRRPAWNRENYLLTFLRLTIFIWNFRIR
jgi:hypothetical protein